MQPITMSSNNTIPGVVEMTSTSTSKPGLLFLEHVQVIEVVLAAWVFLSIHALRQRKRHGLAVWPVVGMLPSLALGVRSNMYEWLSEVLLRHGGTFLFVGPSLSNLKCVITSDPRNVEHILKTSFPNFPKGPYFRDTVSDLLGHGIFSADHDAWLRQRKPASVEFHSARFRSMTVDSLLHLVHERLLPVLDTPATLDLQEVLLRLTFDNVCMIAFGVDPGCLRPGLPDVPFARAFEDATEATVTRFVTPTCLWKLMRYLHLGPEKRLRASIAEVNHFADQVIRTRKRELAAASDRSDLLTVFMGLTDEDGTPFSDKFLREICVNFILAGRDTSSVALTWFFWLIHHNPQVERNIMSEILTIVRDRVGHLDDQDFVFRPEEVKRMDYLHAALSETLRLYPSVPVDHKEVVNDDVFPDGTVLKKGTKVIYAIYAMGRMEGIWGKDCREFRPERWLRDGRFVSESAYKFTAFNGGPRLCLGKDFAYYQMKFVAASILYRFKVKVVHNHPVRPKLAMTMYMKHGLKVNLQRRMQQCAH